MTNNIYVDLHVIQTLPPNNINRDDTGSPKTAKYGGVTRARVSSQSWKKAMRDYFKENINKDKLGIRTKDIVQSLADEIYVSNTGHSEEESLELAEKIFTEAGIATKDRKAKALFFLGSEQKKQLAIYGMNHEEKLDKKNILKILKSNQSIDIALFGRMVADSAELNEDASAQVAHAISTHAIIPEFDFFTAVDDLAHEDSAGAGMLGTVEYNSSTLYRYANVAVHELIRQLNGSKEATIEVLKLFIKSFVLSMPTGKINTFANQTLPNALIITIRPDRPVNLVNAFEQPVKSKDGNVVSSIEKLKAEYLKIGEFVEIPISTFILGDIDGLGKKQTSLNNLMQEFALDMEELLKEILCKADDSL